MLKFKQFLDEGVNDPAIFKAVFLAGGPGSGKSFIVGKTALTALGFRVVNSDDAFEFAMKKAGLTMDPDNIYSIQGQELRDKAKTLTKKRMERYITGRLGLVIDGTGKDYEKISKQKKLLEAIGYETAIIVVNTDLETAIQRDQQRERSIGAEGVKKMWSQVQNNIGKFQSSFHNNFFIVDNSKSSDVEKGTMSVYRRVASWAKEKPKNTHGMRWINHHSKTIDK
jgi:dephospho-CoA kinase